MPAGPFVGLASAATVFTLVVKRGAPTCDMCSLTVRPE